MGRHVFTQFNDYAQELRRRADGAAHAMMRSNFECAARLTDESLRILQREVYDIPEKRYDSAGMRRGKVAWTYSWRGDYTKIGRKVWVRTHELYNEERFTVTADGRVVHRNPAAHMIWRYRYGTEAGAWNQKQARPPQRVSHWYADAIRHNATWIHRNRHQHLFQLLDGQES